MNFSRKLNPVSGTQFTRLSGQRLSLRPFLLASLLLLGAGAGQQAVALSVKQVVGHAELMDGTVWRPLNGTPPVTTSLRTGAGRVTLVPAHNNSNAGQILVGSASRLRLYQNEADFQMGQFYIEGPATIFVLGRHIVMDGTGSFRVDIDQSTRRLAVLRGAVRLSDGNKTYQVEGSQQISFQTSKVLPFQENDPWYLAQFVGVGDATVEAFKGEVLVASGTKSSLAAKLGDALDPGTILRTGANSWAEVGFSGGGYLRLGEKGELLVMSVDKTSRGREVTLQLNKGGAWNVVQKGQGGYKIITPVISTAVRGTTFRVDATGLVKVFEGAVALPSAGDTGIKTGEEKEPNKPVQPLKLDAFDRLNQQLDAERARPMTLKLAPVAHHTTKLALSVQTLPNTTVSATAKNATGQAIALAVTNPSEGLFQLGQQSLPDGVYNVLVQAKRYQSELTRQTVVRIDRTPPTLTDIQVSRVGRILTVTGTAADHSGQPLILSVVSGTSTLTQHVSGTFKVRLPADAAATTQLTLRDGAGNEVHATHP